MKIVICGAGQVGFYIARHLSMEGNNVIVVDTSPELIRRINDNLDAKGIVGHASRPDILEKAGISDADMLVAVTYTDEVNMLACQVAHSLFNVPIKIARIRDQSYLDPAWANLFSREHLPIDVIISPEVEIAKAVLHRLEVPGAFEVIPLAEDKVRLIGVRCNNSCPLINTPIKQLSHLFPNLYIIIVGIWRNDQSIKLSGDDELKEGDHVYFVVETDQVGRAMAAFGYEESVARRLLFCGGGDISLLLAKNLESHKDNILIKIIETNADRAAEVASLLTGTVVLNGDILDPEILVEAGISSANTVLALSEDDESNILCSLLAKKFGAHRVMTLLNKITYEALVSTLGVDVVISPRNITASTILRHVRRGRIHAVHSLREGFGELIEAEALETSSLVGSALRDLDLPGGVMIGAIVRDDQIIRPQGNTIIQHQDRVVLFATSNVVRKVEKLFSVRLEYF